MPVAPAAQQAQQPWPPHIPLSSTMGQATVVSCEVVISRIPPPAPARAGLRGAGLRDGGLMERRELVPAFARWRRALLRLACLRLAEAAVFLRLVPAAVLWRDGLVAAWAVAKAARRRPELEAAPCASHTISPNAKPKSK